jgi:uncharacterized membrane protein YcaP (DUF421 family)
MDTKIWNDMFQLAIPVLEKVLRPLIVYLFLVIGLRLAGKRELAQLNPFDLVVLLTLSNTVQNAIIGNDNTVTGGMIGAATLLLVNYFVVRFFYSHQKIEEFLEGGPDKLIENGEIQLENLSKEVITVAELQEAAHKQGFSSLSEIEEATIGPDGAIAFLGKKPDQLEERYQELLGRLDQISQELIELKAAFSNRGES